MVGAACVSLLLGVKLSPFTFGLSMIPVVAVVGVMTGVAVVKIATDGVPDR